MEGNIGQYKAKERQYDDTVGVQQGVVDESSSTALSAIAGGIASLGEGFITAKSAFDKEEEKQRVIRTKAEKEEAVKKQKEAFEEELLTASLIAEQHGANSAGFKTYLHMAYKYSELDPDSKSKMLRDFQSSVLGKSFTELSPEEEAREANISEATKAGWVRRGASQEEVDRSTDAFIANKKTLQGIKDRKSIAEARLTDLNLTDKEREEAKFEARKLQREALLNLSSSGRHTQKILIEDVVSQLEQGVAVSEVKKMLRTKQSDLKAMINTVTKDLKDRTEVDILANPLLELYDIAIAKVDSVALSEDIDAQIGKILKTEKLVLMQDKQTAQTAAASSIYGHSAGIQALTNENASRIALRILKGNSDPDSRRGGDLVADTAEKAEGARAYLSDIKSAINSLGKVDYKGDLLIDPEEVRVNVENILKGSSRFITEEDSPKELQPIIEFLASPEFSSYLSQQNGLSEDARDNLQSTLESNAIVNVYPAVMSAMDEVTYKEQATSEPKEVKSGRSRYTTKPEEVADRPSGRGRSGRSTVTKAFLDELDIQVIGNEVRFVGTTRDSSEAAKRLNKKVGLTLSSYTKAIANLTESSIEEALSMQMRFFWPDPVEDDIYQGPDGKSFEIKDGKRVGN